MTASGHDCHRECLGARPVHHGGQGHGVVLLAMHHQRAQMGLGRHRGYGRSGWQPVPTSTARVDGAAAATASASAWLVTNARTRSPPGPAVARLRPRGHLLAPRPAGLAARHGLRRARPGVAPTPRKLKRTAVQPHCTKARARVCTTLLSMVPPNRGWGWAITATPRGAPPSGTLAASRATSMAPAGPCRVSRSVWAFTFAMYLIAARAYPSSARGQRF